MHGKRKLKRNLEVIAALGSNPLNVSRTTSTIKEPGKANVTAHNRDIEKFGTKQERQIPLKVYANRHGLRTSETLVEKRIQSRVKDFTRTLKGDKKMKQKRQDPGSGVFLLRYNIARKLRVRISNFRTFRRPEANKKR